MTGGVPPFALRRLMELPGFALIALRAGGEPRQGGGGSTVRPRQMMNDFGLRAGH